MLEREEVMAPPVELRDDVRQTLAAGRDLPLELPEVLLRWLLVIRRHGIRLYAIRLFAHCQFSFSVLRVDSSGFTLFLQPA